MVAQGAVRGYTEQKDHAGRAIVVFRGDVAAMAARAYSPAAARSVAALSVLSQVNSGSSRPK